MATTGLSLEAVHAGIIPEITPTNIETNIPTKKFVKDNTTSK